MANKRRAEGQINKKEHDVLVYLAEDVPWQLAIEGFYAPPGNGALYRLMEKLDVKAQGSFEDNAAALIAEAKARGYRDEIYVTHYDDKKQEIEELGHVLPEFYDVLQREEHQ